MSGIRITFVAAMAENRCIGFNNQIPWNIPEDFRHFKNVTAGKPCIMGRKTFESILDILGKPLPDRANIVISRSGYAHEGAISASSLEEALDRAGEIARQEGQEEICIIGGGEIFRQSLPIADRMELTRIHKTFEGDAFFPEFNENEWKETWREDREEPMPFSFIRYERR